MADKPSNPEEDYFAREEAEKRYRLAKELAEREKVAEAEALKTAHWMKCPKCGHDLSTVSVRGVEIDKCFHCNGMFLDDGEFEKLAEGHQENKVINAIVNVFRRSPR